MESTKDSSELSNDEYMRYSRQLIMPTIGIDGQKKLKGARVLIVGAGGLGSPAALYLSGAGVGTIGLCDADTVEESNLHRQVIHNESKLGVNKTVSAKMAMNLFNRHVEVATYEVNLTSQNAYSIVKDWDIVMDGSDNAKTRYLINDICVILKKPLVSGSALQLEGQVTVYNYKGGPCYRCMFPQPPPPATVTNCSDGGVLGMVPGLIGQIQAIEIVKIILGFTEEQILTKRMIFFDAANMKFRNVKLRERNVQCNVCGDTPSVTDVALIDYDDFCQTHCNKFAMIQLPKENSITMEEFASQLLTVETKTNLLIDVRPKVQYDIVNVPGSIHMPLKAIIADVEGFKKIAEGKEKIFVMCRRGGTSKEATEFILKDLGMANAINVQGGITEYVKKVDPSLPIY